MARNRNVVVFVCKECGARARASKQSGRLLSHPLPGTMKTCAATGSRVVEPVQSRKKNRRPQVGTRTSVQAVSGGLPGLGKKR